MRGLKGFNFTGCLALLDPMDATAERVREREIYIYIYISHLSPNHPSQPEAPNPQLRLKLRGRIDNKVWQLGLCTDCIKRLSHPASSHGARFACRNSRVSTNLIGLWGVDGRLYVCDSDYAGMLST